jgi:antitoxin PrlF
LVLSTVTSKGQITIPIELRRAVGLETGAQVEFIVNTRHRIELVPRHADLRALRGSVPAPRPAVGVPAMSAAIAAAGAGDARKIP